MTDGNQRVSGTSEAQYATMGLWHMRSFIYVRMEAVHIWIRARTSEQFQFWSVYYIVLIIVKRVEDFGLFSIFLEYWS